ncbi:LysE/ArgO family amino acid transporter [Peribacillus asahii]|uniref:LysE/ArgO family amino acid transporter n=1 Tax=Peribacillus asahii TaxID=228899 RepID=UPI0038113FD3
MLSALLHGIILAFGLILPLGAQNIFIFNQGASQPRLRGAIPVIITASLCDTFLILLAVLGVSIIVLTVPALQIGIFSIGIVFLLYMGWSIWNSDTANVSQKETAIHLPPKILLNF